MRSMQTKFTAEVERIAEAAGLEAAETLGAAGDIGRWWIQDGFATRLVIEFRFNPGGVTLTASGPAANHAAEHISRWNAEPYDDGYGYQHTLDYAEPDSFDAFWALLADLLGPWRSAASIVRELAATRAGLLDDQQHGPAERLGQAIAALSPPAGEHPHRAAAAGWLDEALGLLPERGTRQGRTIAVLADLLATAPAELV